MKVSQVGAKFRFAQFSGLLLLPLISALAQPASAQNAARPTNLPDASHIQPSRLRVQFVDTSPIVTDTRKREEDTTYVINVPPMPAAKHQVVQIGQPGDPGVNGGAPGDSNAAPIRTSRLPDAGFQSNIPAKATAPGRSLPDGTSSNGLKNVLAHKLDTAPRASAGNSNSRAATPQAQTPAAKRTLMYTPSTSADSLQVQKTTTDVSGKKLPRHSLLHTQ